MAWHRDALKRRLWSSCLAVGAEHCVASVMQDFGLQEAQPLHLCINWGEALSRPLGTMDAEIELLVRGALSEHGPPKGLQHEADGGAKRAETQVCLTMCPHDGFVILDKLVNGTSLVTHRVTL